jgi:hypothetical protein
VWSERTVFGLVGKRGRKTIRSLLGYFVTS